MQMKTRNGKIDSSSNAPPAGNSRIVSEETGQQKLRGALRLRLRLGSCKPIGVPMPRFVILEHNHPTLHWDLMLEAGDVLQTWRLAAAPAIGATIDATALERSSAAYLDYEGPISGGRGNVQRRDAGDFTEEADSTPTVRQVPFSRQVRVRARLPGASRRGDLALAMASMNKRRKAHLRLRFRLGQVELRRRFFQRDRLGLQQRLRLGVVQRFAMDPQLAAVHLKSRQDPARMNLAWLQLNDGHRIALVAEEVDLVIELAAKLAELLQDGLAGDRHGAGPGA